MKRIILAMAVAMLLAGITGAQAQGPGGFTPDPAMMAKFKAWQQWRGTHKNVDGLRQTLHGLMAVEQNPKTAMPKAQAKVTLAALNKWRAKPVLSDAQALLATRELTKTLTLPQLKAFAAASARRGGPGGGGGRGPGGGGGFGGGGRGPGGPGMTAASFPAPHDYNPLNPNTLPFARMRPRLAQEMGQLVATLKSAH